jgi:hypothetical protein
MTELITQGLSSAGQLTLIVEGLRSGEITPPISEPFFLSGYNFQGLVETIIYKWGPVTGARRPYRYNWDGVIKATVDSSLAGTTRGGWYADSIRGFQEVLWDFFGAGFPGQDISDLYDATFEDTIQLLEQNLGSFTPGDFPNNMKGLILAILATNVTNSPDRLLLEDGFYLLLEDGFKVKAQYA